LKRTWLLIIAVLVLGAFSVVIQFQAARPAALADSIADYQDIQANFTLVDEPVKFSKSQNYSVGIKITAASIKGQSQSFAAKGRLESALSNLHNGETFECLLSLSPTPMGEREGFRATCKDEPVLIRSASKANKVITQVRQAFMQNLRGVSADSTGLVAGLAIGDVSQISTKLQEDMKLVSLAHLTAVSGANCAIVLAMFYLIARRMGGGRWTRLSVGLSALIAYVLLVGPQPSVLRAAVMASAVLIGITLGRKTAPLSALAASVIILLVADPWLAVDFGFALSVAATAGLLLLTRPIAERLERYFPKWLAIALSVSIAAQIFCLPILLQLQQGLATYSLPANLLAAPLVAPITVLGILGCIFAWCFPPITWFCTYLASAAGWLITKIVEGFVNSDNVTIGWPVGISGGLIASCVIVGFLLWLKAEPTILRNLGILSLAAIAALSAGFISFNLVTRAQWPINDWSVVACDVGQGDSLVVRSQGKVAVIDVGREGRLVDECLQRLKIRKIDLLVLTHFDMDHIGGLSGAIGGREVDLAMVSPFKDERWGATGTNRQLAEAGIRTFSAERGMTGKLGEIQWQVLWPNRFATGAEDSNDASIIMLWQSKAFNLLTMADSGEKSQMRIAADKSWWSKPTIHSLPLVLKVSHHGSSDQYGELIEELKPDLSLISAGRNNSYGHPTKRTLTLLAATGSAIYRTDELGSIAVASREGGLALANSPRG
jgi:competence protein ComEC